MAFVVETGAGLADANSYASESEFDAYVEARAITSGSGDVEAALVRASAWIDARFGARFPGYRRNGRSQGLEWPRLAATDRAGQVIPSDEVPIEIKRATIEAALRETVTAGSLAPDVTAAAGAVKRFREKLGSMEEETEYFDGATGGGSPVFPVINGILAPLIGASGGGMVQLLRA